MRAYLVAATCVALVSACGGPIGPAQVALPLDSLEIVGIPQSGTVGDRFPLKVTATYLHGETADVTSQVTWTSTRDETAAVQRLESDGTFRGSSSLFAGIPDSQPHGVSTVKGLILDSIVSGVEKIASHLCPSGLGIVSVEFESR